MEFFSSILNYNKTNDYLLHPNCDPLLTSSQLTNENVDDFLPKLNNNDLPLDVIDFQSFNDIEDPYQSLLTQLNPVDLSPNPYIDELVLEQRITNHQVNSNEQINCQIISNNQQQQQNGIDKYDQDHNDEDDYPNDQLIIDCLLEDSCDIGDLCDLEDETEIDEPMNIETQSETGGYLHGDDNCLLAKNQETSNDDQEKQIIELTGNFVNEGNDNCSTGSKSEKENKAPNVDTDLSLTQYTNHNNQLLTIEFQPLDTVKRDSNQEISNLEPLTFQQQNGNNGIGQSSYTLVPFQPTFTNLPYVWSSPAPPPVPSSNSSSTPCCRKHEKYYKKLKNRKSDRPIKEKILVVEYLYIPLDSRIGSYLKPKFSHNILCAFAILCGADEDMMIEVSGIYRFLCKCFPYFETAELHWKNSLRHSLTTCNWFHKTEVHRTAMKGYKWTINWDQKTCLAWEINKQCIKDVTSLYHCLSGPRVCEDLIKVGLLEDDPVKLSMLRQRFN